ncbi:tape measure domain-containing protein [Streptococcus gallolyticus]|uniref:Tape measure domain-containing protein n=1 Tax=Streptococcus gallolyticus TaxID=315405 RepID=A0A1I7JH50_9STRE|nr:tape measure protein [Streptococcus gallolyticus]SFC83325.1 tape measure domain-containing protein [Streptococcus gallolyticus]SFU84539.1 tape measure domain-containing protein [Streptococcus gallolyticus]
MADGKVTITIDMDGNEAQSKVKSLKNAILGIGDSSSSSFGSGSKSAALFGAAAGAASAIVQKGMSVVSSSMDGAISRVDTMNKFPKTMALFGYSAEESSAAVDKLSKGIEGLPTTLDSAVSSAQQLTITTGSLEKGTDLALAFNNAMLGYGATTDGATNALRQFNQSLGSGKIQGEEFNSIAEAAPGLMNKMAEAFGYGSNGVTQLKSDLSSGKISAQQFADKLIELNDGVDGFAAMAQASSGGIATSFQNIKSAIVKNLGNVINAIDQAASNTGLGTISQNLDKVKAAINGAFGDSESMVQKFSSAFQSFFNPLLLINFQGAIEEVKGAVDALASAFTGVYGGSTSWILTLSNTLSVLVGMLAAAGKAAQKFINAFADTGAIQAVKFAINDVLMAISTVTYEAGETSIWATLGTAIGNVVKIIAQAVSAIANFIARLDPSIVRTFTNVIVGAIAGFKGLTLGAKALGLGIKGLDFIKSLNPFKAFRKNAEDGMNGATNSASRSKSVIGQIFNGLANIIKSTGTAIKTAATGIGQGLFTAFKGLGAALKTAGIGNILALGAAVSIAAVGIGAGIAIVVASLTLLADHSKGVSEIISALGDAFATVATALIGAFADAIVTVSGVLPIVTSALANLSPLVVAVGEAIGAAAPAITALGEALTSIIGVLPPVISAFGSAVAEITTALTPIVQIVGDVFVQVVTVISNAIVQIIEALSPFIPALTEMVVAIAPILAQIVEAFNNLISQISPIIDSIANLFKTLGEQISNILDSAKGIITGFGDAVRNVLDGIAGIFDSMGNAALNAGKGVKQMAQGIKILVDLKLGDLAATLTTTAIGLGKMASHASGMSQLGTAMTQTGTGMSQFGSGAKTALSALTQFDTVMSTLKSSLTQLPSLMTTASSGFSTFTSQAVAGVSGLSAINAPIASFKAQITSITPALMSASSSFASFGVGAMVISATFATIGALITSFNAKVMTISMVVSLASGSFRTLSASILTVTSSLSTVASGMARVGTSAVSATSQIRNMATSTQYVISAFNTMRGQVQSSMLATLAIIISVGNQMKSQGRAIGQQTSQNLAQGIASGAGRASSAMSALMGAVRSAGMAGVGSMRSIGAMIGQGLAQGMYSSLGSVTAAANALIAQAEKAAKAAASIHSPSRLFRDEVGRYIAQGIAVGIEKDSYTVNDALAGMYDKVRAFSYKAEDIIGVGSSNFSRNIQIKSDLDKAIKAKVEIVQEKSNGLLEKALDTVDKLADRPVEMRLYDDTLVAATGDKYQDYQNKQIIRQNRMRGITS